MKLRAVALGVAVIVGVYYFTTSDDSVNTQSQSQNLSSVTNQHAVTSQHNKEKTSSAEVATEAAFGKEYVLSSDTLVLFDQVIAQSESKEHDDLLEALVNTLTSMSLNTASIEWVSELFSRYVQYKATLASVKSVSHAQPFSSDDMESKLFAIQGLRQDYFSQEEILTLFGEQQLYDEMALARLRIQQDKGLSAEQKQQLLEDNIAQLPEAMKTALQPSMDIRRVQSIKAESSELTREQKLARFSAEFGEEAGQRLLAAQDKAQSWNNRVTQIKSQIALLQGDAELTDESRLAQIQALKEGHFSAQELKRLDVFLRNPQLLGQQ